MFKFGKLVLGLSFCLPVFWAGVGLKAQTTEANLYDLECQSKTPQIQSPLQFLGNQNEVRIGRDKFAEVAYLYNKYIADFGDVLDKSEYGAEVTCKLPTGFSKLNLAFGLDKDNNATDKLDMVVLEVYADRKMIDQVYIRREADIQSLSLDIQNSQNVTLKASCVNPMWWNNCPRLSFTQMRVN